MALTALLLFALFNVSYAANLGGKYTKGGTETSFTGKTSLADAVDAVKADDKIMASIKLGVVIFP